MHIFRVMYSGSVTKSFYNPKRSHTLEDQHPGGTQTRCPLVVVIMPDYMFLDICLCHIRGSTHYKTNEIEYETNTVFKPYRTVELLTL